MCGALLADSNQRLRLVFLANIAKVPYRFLVRIADVNRVRADARGTGHRVIGLFHSHPVGYPNPSPRDKRACTLRSCMLIYDVCGAEARLWRIGKKGRRRVAHSVPLGVETRPPNKAMQQTRSAMASRRGPRS